MKAFSLALLSAAASAACSEQTKANFLGAAAAYDWDIRSVDDLGFRLEVYAQNEKKVEWLNEHNVGVSFAQNEMSHLTDEEFAEKTGANVPADQTGRQLFHEDGEGRRLNNAQNVNWVTAGKMLPVKNQGGCGSCWAFAAASAMEGVQAIQNGQKIRLSEQEGVDCVSKSHGCGGGWMSHYWEWTRDNNGAQSNEDYPYEAKTMACRNQQGKTAVSQASGWGNARSLDEMKSRLAEGPMTIAVAAGNDCWRYYSAGILSAANNCPTNIDHGVVLVGLHMPGDGDDGDNNDGDDGDNNDGDDGDNNDGDDGDDDEQEYKRVCRRASRAERRARECDGEDETLEPNRRGKLRRCCHYVPVEFEPFQVQNDEESSQAYWIVQNSWGTRWGDNGFVKLAVEEGVGVSGMNQYVQYVNVSP